MHAGPCNSIWDIVSAEGIQELNSRYYLEFSTEGVLATYNADTGARASVV